MPRWLLVVLSAAALYSAWGWWQVRPASPVWVDARQVPAPLQTVTTQTPFQSNHHKGYQFTPLADFVVTARLLRREPYRFGASAKLAPLDLVLGWGDMADPAIYRQIDISQGQRFYHIRAKAWPLPPQRIMQLSTNLHAIAADSIIAKQLQRLRPGQMVQLTGQLVRVQGDDGFVWQSSLSRDDTGGGACEVMWVQRVQACDEAACLGRVGVTLLR